MRKYGQVKNLIRYGCLPLTRTPYFPCSFTRLHTHYMKVNKHVLIVQVLRYLISIFSYFSGGCMIMYSHFVCAMLRSKLLYRCPPDWPTPKSKKYSECNSCPFSFILFAEQTYLCLNSTPGILPKGITHLICLQKVSTGCETT